MERVWVQVGGMRVTARVLRGALVRDGLRGAPPGTSALLVMPRRGRWALTMAGVSYDLDAIGLDESGRVVGVLRGLPAGAPGPFSLRRGVSAILEVPAGHSVLVAPGQRARFRAA